jgi:hypothetical protein
MVNRIETLKAFGLKPNPFRVHKYFLADPGLERSDNPGLTLANAFGVIN